MFHGIPLSEVTVAEILGGYEIERVTSFEGLIVLTYFCYICIFYLLMYALTLNSIYLFIAFCEYFNYYPIIILKGISIPNFFLNYTFPAEHVHNG